MTEISDRPRSITNGYPLSAPQELWYSGDQGDQAGFFGSGFVLAGAWRITGRVDVDALRSALGDVVERHEILRTVVARDVERPYQRVHPACPVPLEVRDVPLPVGRSREVRAEELLTEAEQGAVNPRQVPLLRTGLTRFDDTDSVLTLVTHHTAVDEWAMQVIIRDLAAFYRARTTGGSAELPAVHHYREFTAWQQAHTASDTARLAREYWRQRMRGARIFAVPTDRPVPDRHTQPYSAHNFVVDTEVMDAARAAAAAAETSVEVVLLAAFTVLAHWIAGTTDQAIDTLTTGRIDPRFDDTVGAVMNFLVFRTELATCESFRDVVASTRDSWDEAHANEIPIQQIEWDVPELMEPNEDSSRTQCIIGFFRSPFDLAQLRIAEKSYEIRKRERLTPVGPWIPHGVAWALHLVPSGELCACVQFNREELDESTVVGWTTGYRRILSNAAQDPDQRWKAL